MKNPHCNSLQATVKSIARTRITALMVLLAVVITTPASYVYSQCDTVFALSCETAPLIPLENYCGRTNIASVYCCLLFCGPTTAIHNPTYHEFVALDSNFRIEILVLPCETGFGLQAAIISTCPWENADILDCNPGAAPGDTIVLTADGLMAGQSYWLLIDGSSGAMCNFLILDVEGAFQPETPVINLQTSGTTLQAVPAGNETYTYAWFECEANEVIGTGQIFEAPGNGCYCVTVRDSLYASTFCTEVLTTSSGDASASSEVIMYPNPSASTVDIVVADQHQGALTLVIYDNQGRVVQEARIEDGKYRHAWQDNHSAGIYLFVVSSGQEVLTRRPIIYSGK
jgi:hypothetical protein